MIYCLKDYSLLRRQLLLSCSEASYSRSSLTTSLSPMISPSISKPLSMNFCRAYLKEGVLI